jgi:hypothetical protein
MTDNSGKEGTRSRLGCSLTNLVIVRIEPGTLQAATLHPLAHQVRVEPMGHGPPPTRTPPGRWHSARTCTRLVRRSTLGCIGVHQAQVGTIFSLGVSEV